MTSTSRPSAATGTVRPPRLRRRRWGRSHPPRRWQSALTLALGVALLVPILEKVAPTTLDSSGPGRNIQLAGANGATPYTPEELWGGGSPAERCLACTPSELLGTNHAQSVQAGQSVNPATADFTTSNTLFSIPTVTGQMGFTLTYDAERSTSPSAWAGVGNGWMSTFNPSFGYSSYIATVNQENGAQVAFYNPDVYGLAKNGCPALADQDFQHYTIPGSSEPFCAYAGRVDAQAGVFPSYGWYGFEERGGEPDYAFNIYGQPVFEGDSADGADVTFSYNLAAGQQGCSAGSGQWCDQETEGGRTVTAIVNGYGVIVSVFNPIGQEWTLGYDGNANLTSITNDAYAGLWGLSTWSYAYTTGASSPYNHEISKVTDPDGDQTQVAYYGSAAPGMVNTVTDPSGATTTYYGFQQTTCSQFNQSGGGCTASGQQQQTSVSYPDGERDTDQYLGGLLTADIYGPSAAPSTTNDVTWDFNYNFNGDGSYTEYVNFGAASSPLAQATIVADPVGDITSYTDPNGNVTASMYNETFGTDTTAGNNHDELCWTWSVPTGSSVPGNASCTNPPSGSTHYTYDQYGDELSETDPAGNTSYRGYYANGLLCWTSEPSYGNGSSCSGNGTGTSGAPTGSIGYQYDGYGDVTSKAVGIGTTTGMLTLNGYTELGQLSYTIPPDGQSGCNCSSNPYATSYVYYGDGNVETKTEPYNRVTQYTDDAAGNVLNEADPGGVTSTAYDQDGRVCYRLRASTAVSNPTCSSVPSGSSRTIAYQSGTDAPVWTADPNNNSTVYSYGNLDVPTSPTEVQTGAGSSTPETTYTSFDWLGNDCLTGPVQAGSAYGSVCAWLSGDTYTPTNSEGQLIETEDPNGDNTAYTYGDTAYPTEPTEVVETTLNNATTTYYYDADGRRGLAQDPEGNWVTTVYDTNGHLCYLYAGPSFNACSSPPTGASVFSYDAADERTKMVDNYGAGNQVTDTYTYDSDGNLTAAQDDNGRTIAYAYDQAAEVACIAYPVASGPNCNNAPSTTNTVVDRSYDGDGRLSSSTDWLGHTIHFGNYNPSSELGQVTYPTSPTAEALAYGYDPANNLTSANYSGAFAGANAWSYNADEQEASTSQLGVFSSPSDTYNNYRQVTLASNPTGSGSIADSYTYHPNGEIQTDQPSGKSPIGFAYNGGAELTSVTNPNQASPDTSIAYTADGQRCWSHAASSFVQSPSCGSPPSGATSYQWNVLGQLCWSGTTTSTAACSSPPSGATTYTYDGDGLRMSEKPASGSQLTFSWDTVGSVPMLLDDGENAYIYGDPLFGGSAPVEQINLSTSAVSYLSAIPSGVQDVINASGTVKEQSAYSTYGVQNIESGSPQTPFGFQGGYQDISGLVYLVNRYYDPTTDQFVSVDPEVATTAEPYAFTGDDSLNSTDPLGIDICLGCQIAAQSAVDQTLPPAIQSIVDSTPGGIEGWAATGFKGWAPVSSNLREESTGIGGLAAAQRALDDQIGQDWIEAGKVMASYKQANENWNKAAQALGLYYAQFVLPSTADKGAVSLANPQVRARLYYCFLLAAICRGDMPSTDEIETATRNNHVGNLAVIESGARSGYSGQLVAEDGGSSSAIGAQAQIEIDFGDDIISPFIGDG